MIWKGEITTLKNPSKAAEKQLMCLHMKHAGE